MAAEFSLPLTAEGAVTAPTGVLAFTEPSAETQTFLDIGPASVLEIPEFGYAIADGVNPLRLIIQGGVYDCGGIAPFTTPTLANAGGTRATVVGTYTGQPANGETFVIGDSRGTYTITWKSTLDMSGFGPSWQVKIGADADTSYTNLQKFINNTGTQGVEYFNLWIFSGISPSTFAENANIEVSALDTGANTITFRYTEYGTYGNATVSTETVSNFSFASSTFTGGVDGTGTAPGAGTYRYFYTWYRSIDGAETGRSKIATITTAANNNITVSDLTASADTTFDFINVYRTTDRGVEFYLSGAVARASTTYTDDVLDEDLVVGTPWNDLNYRAYAEGAVPRGLALAYWKNAIWTLGAHLHADYARGTCDVTNGNQTITFSGFGVHALMVGRTFQVASTSETYTIISVIESGGTALIDRVYEGTTAAGVTYKIIDDYDARALRRCLPYKYNQWPVEQSPGSIDTDDPIGGTALLATRSRLFAFSKTSISVVTGDDIESWELNKIADNVGCVAHTMIAAAEGGGLFLSTDGFYAISPDETLVCISSPKVPKGSVAQGIDDTIQRINWATVAMGYAVYNHEERIVIFGLPLDGAITPNYEIIFDLQNQTWTLYKRAEWTGQTRILLSNGDPAMVAGDREGNIWHVDIGESDGFYGTEAVQTLTGAQTVRTLTVSGTPFSTTGDGEVGKPVLILYANGTTVAYGKVASNTTSALTLAEDLATAPAASDQIVLGGIAWQAKSGFTTLGEELRQKDLRCVTIRHAPTTRGEYFFSFAVDGGSFSLASTGTSIGDLSSATGKTTHEVLWPGDTHAINIRGFKPGGQAIIRGGVFDFNLAELGNV